MNGMNRMAKVVAARWMRKAAQLHVQLDALARLQVLEGAFDLVDMPFSSPALDGQLNLRPHDFTQTLRRMQTWIAEQSAVADLPFDIHPRWFKINSTDMYQIFFRRTQQYLDRAGVADVSTDDLIQSALAGIGKRGDKVKKPMWGAGRYLAEGIKSGRETPEKVAAGMGGRFLFNKVLSEITTLRRREELTGRPVDTGPSDPTVDAPVEQVEDPGLSRTRRGEYLMDVFLDPNDRLGEKIRNEVRWIWHDWRPNEQKILNWWLDTFVATGHSPGTTEMGKHFMNDPAFSTMDLRSLVNGTLNRTWSKFLREFSQFQMDFWDSDLGDELDNRMEVLGLRSDKSWRREDSRLKREEWEKEQEKLKKKAALRSWPSFLVWPFI